MKIRTSCPFLLFICNIINLANGLNSTVFHPSKLEKLVMGSERVVSVWLCKNMSQVDVKSMFVTVKLVVDHPKIASVSGDQAKTIQKLDMKHHCAVNFTIKGNLLGRATAHLVKSVHSKSSSLVKKNFTRDALDPEGNEDSDEEDNQVLSIVVTKQNSFLNKVFVTSIAVLVSLSYVNMGCSLDLEVVKSVIKKPVAPTVGLICQYICMPLISFGFAHAFFPAKISILKMGLFTLGCSPGGGASNMWTYLLGGNLNLSLTMTFISTIAALGMMPLWLFTLGKIIFDENHIKIPFVNIMTILVALIVPVGIGLLIKRFQPRVAKVFSKLLAPFSIVLIVYIICFGVYVNLYMFKFFTWQVVIGALCTIWSGFIIGMISSWAMKFRKEDIIAISIETGIQNTGIAYILLSHSLEEPESDISAVVPVAASIMMPIPLILYYTFKKIHECMNPSSKMEEAPPTLSGTGSTEQSFVLTPQDCDTNKAVI